MRLLDTPGVDRASMLGGLFLRGPRAAAAQRRLLWRVRRKPIISYIFIGFIPAILIIAFCLLGGLLLFSNFSVRFCSRACRTLTPRADRRVDHRRRDPALVARHSGFVSRRQAAIARARTDRRIHRRPSRSCGRVWRLTGHRRSLGRRVA